jgi:hypothetical protein
MSKPNGFIKLHRYLWSSDEWRNLSPNAQVVLIDILYRYNSKNNGEITYGLRDAVLRLHCGKSTAWRALEELKAAGLISIAVKASFDLKSSAGRGKATTWRLAFLS